MEQEHIEKPLFAVFCYMSALRLCHGKAKKHFFSAGPCCSSNSANPNALAQQSTK